MVRLPRFVERPKPDRGWDPERCGAAAESVNARIHKINGMACGFRNRARFRTAIFFHLGGLNLYPAVAIHSKAGSDKNKGRVWRPLSGS